MGHVFVILLVIVLILSHISKADAVGVTFQITFTLSNINAKALGIDGIKALVDSTKKILNVNHVVLLSQESYEQGWKSGSSYFTSNIVEAVVSVFASTDSYLATSSLINANIDSDQLYSYLTGILNTAVSDGTFTLLLQEYARDSGIQEMNNAKADYATPSKINFDGTHDTYHLNAGGVAGIVLGVFFSLLLCGFCGFMYIKHRSEYGLAPNEPVYTQV